MTQEVFNKVFDTYRQQVIKTLEESTDQNFSQPDAEPNSVYQLLREHVKEWQQHYRQQDQALQEVMVKYQLMRQGPHRPTGLESERLGSDEETECQQITSIFQHKRETIWQRQQVELLHKRISL